MLSLKSKYQTQEEKNEPQPLQNYSAVPLKPKSDEKQKVDDNMLHQIDRFNKNKMVQGQIEQLFKEDMKLEYELLMVFRKEILKV